ncbi:uncharacterized protein LOC129972482 [Argiope bruennichi]|uniref:uncharacterized protein LOC129972482 n=1 Tax=Argiope bruennichi TaxID=94029 RepID=UPI002494B8FD|nr:uncharacterized protein LOC129972482 [Argiope bruennichi]
MIVLSWIKKETSQLKTFVANRVATLQDLSCQEQWRHVSSGDNPADLISRGVNPSKMLESNLWWEGPAFLKNSEYPCREISDSVIKDDVDWKLDSSYFGRCLDVISSIGYRALFPVTSDITFLNKRDIRLDYNRQHHKLK